MPPEPLPDDPATWLRKILAPLPAVDRLAAIGDPTGEAARRVREYDDLPGRLHQMVDDLPGRLHQMVDDLPGRLHQMVEQSDAPGLPDALVDPILHKFIDVIMEGRQ